MAHTFPPTHSLLNKYTSSRWAMACMLNGDVSVAGWWWQIGEDSEQQKGAKTLNGRLGMWSSSRASTYHAQGPGFKPQQQRGRTTERKTREQKRGLDAFMQWQVRKNLAQSETGCRIAKCCASLSCIGNRSSQDPGLNIKISPGLLLPLKWEKNGVVFKYFSAEKKQEEESQAGKCW